MGVKQHLTFCSIAMKGGCMLLPLSYYKST